MADFITNNLSLDRHGRNDGWFVQPAGDRPYLFLSNEELDALVAWRNRSAEQTVPVPVLLIEELRNLCRSPYSGEGRKPGTWIPDGTSAGMVRNWLSRLDALLSQQTPTAEEPKTSNKENIVTNTTTPNKPITAADIDALRNHGRAFNSTSNADTYWRSLMERAADALLTEFERGVREGVHNALAYFRDENGHSTIDEHMADSLDRIEAQSIDETLADEAQSAARRG